VSPVVRDWLTPAATFVSLLLVGLVAGIFLATQLGQVRVQNTLGARDFTLVKHSFEVALGGVMPVLVIAAGISIGPLVGMHWSAGALRLTLVLVALLLWVGVVVVTLIYNAPVNSLAAQWDPSAPPANWEALRDRWHLGQAIRTALAIASFAAVAMIAVLPNLRGR
jgi:uncharacterized membrane protein